MNDHDEEKKKRKTWELKFTTWKGKQGKIGLLTTGRWDLEFSCIQSLRAYNISVQGHIGCQIQTRGQGKREGQTHKHTKVQNIHRHTETLYSHPYLCTNIYPSTPNLAGNTDLPQTSLLHIRVNTDMHVATYTHRGPRKRTHKHPQPSSDNSTRTHAQPRDHMCTQRNRPACSYTQT